MAAFLEGKYAQAFPTFGSERMGAPVTAFCRIDDKPIRLREPIAEPDALIIQDATLLHHVPVFSGLLDSGYVLVNSSHSFAELELSEIVNRLPGRHGCTLAATQLAMQHVGRPIPNAALLGGFAAITGLLSIDSIASAINSRFPGRVGEKNVAAALAAYGQVRERTLEYAAAD